MRRLFRSKPSDFEIETLEVHNEYRCKHGVPPVVLNKKITKVSQKWAEILAKKNTTAYSPNRSYGENVYCGWSLDPNTEIEARDCIEKWYSEIDEYSFEKEPEELTCGRFTQIVWKSTKEIGVGWAKARSGKLYVVVNYFPIGNQRGQFMKNVFPLGSSLNDSPLESNNNIAPPSPIGVLYNRFSPPSPNKRSSIENLDSCLLSKCRSFAISIEMFKYDFLTAHNEYRMNHGVAPLELCNTLCSRAANWAKALAERGIAEHNNQAHYGENLFYTSRFDSTFTITAAEPVEKWYSEITKFKFGHEPTDMVTGHFSQVVWEDTERVGVGVAKSKKGQIFVVANYFPRGNVEGRYGSKVKPPIK